LLSFDFLFLIFDHYGFVVVALISKFCLFVHSNTPFNSPI
jgi:hypothetical protein